MDAKMERERLVGKLVREGYIRSDRVRKAMLSVPRELFLDEELRPAAYADSPLPIGHGQTISAPHMVAMMCEALDIEEGQRILEVGGGCGYHAAVMAELVGGDGFVVTMEIVPQLAERAEKNLRNAGIRNVKVIQGDGCADPPSGPFHRISVAAASPDIPPPLIEHLMEGGMLVIPVGGYGYQNLLRVKRIEDGIIKEDLGGVVFVPLRGRFGH